MRILVTGGSGFLGKRVLDEAAARGLDVAALVRSDAADQVVRRHGATSIRGDLDDAAGLADAFAAARCDALLNIASLGFGHAGAIVAAAESAGLRRAVFVSTTAVTTTLNAPSKAVRLAAEETVRSSGLDWTIVRPTMIYGGADDRNIARLLTVLRRTPVLPVPGGGVGLQQPVHVEDLAAVLVNATLAADSAHRTYDVAGPEPLPFRRLIETAKAAVGSRTLLVPVPLTPVIAAAGLYGRLSRHPRVTAEQFQRLAEDKAFSNDAAIRDLGHRPRSFADGVRRR
jgi:uncharacterized protein YbjT (DUF2867 family)